MNRESLKLAVVGLRGGPAFLIKDEVVKVASLYVGSVDVYS